MQGLLKNAFQLREIHGQEKFKTKLKKAPKQLFPINLEKEYERYLLGYVNTFYQAYLDDQEVLKLIVNPNPLIRDSIALKKDAAGDEIDAFWDNEQRTFRETITDDDLTRFLTPWALSVSVFNRNQINKVITGMTGIDITILDPNLSGQIDLFVKNNVNLIRTIDQRFFDQVRDSTFRNYAAGNRFSVLQKEITERYQVSRTNAKRIARDQTNKLNGQLTEIRQTNLDIDEYFWRTVGDERVRPSHAAHDGKKFKWSKPPSDTGHPGHDIQCRCVAEPVLDFLIEQ